MPRKNLIFMVGIISLLFISGCAQLETDVQLTHRIFNSLCSGNRGVENLIDWETLKAVGMDVGQAYSKIISEKERADYRRAFFYNLTFSFKAAKGRTSAFFNWRVQNRVGNNTIVAADTTSGKVILFTLTIKGGKRKLTAIDWQQ